MATATATKHRQSIIDPDTALPPSDLEAEQATLGSMMLNPTAAQVALGALTAEDFYREVHREIFVAMQRVAERGEPIEIITATAELRRVDKLDEAGGAAYLYSIMQIPRVDHIGTYVDIVRDCAHRRRVIEIGAELQRRGLAGAETHELIEWADWQISDLHIQRGKDQAPAPALTTYTSIGRQVSETEWLWPSWIPRGHLSCIIGPPGCGKTFCALALAACVTEGRAWPDGTEQPGDPAPVLWLDYEAGEGTLYQRMTAAGIDANHFLAPTIGTDVFLTDPQAPEYLRQWLHEQKPGLVVIDSLRHAFPGVDENDSKIAAYLQPLARVAQQSGTPILLIHHTTKRQDRRPDVEAWELDMESARGSSAITALTRSVIAVDKPDPATLTLRLNAVKHNLCAKPDPIGFTIRGDEDNTRVEWTHAPRRQVEIGPRELAMEFLRRELQHGPKTFTELRDLADAEGISQPTLYRAREALGLNTGKAGWALPAVYQPGSGT